MINKKMQCLFILLILFSCSIYKKEEKKIQKSLLNPKYSFAIWIDSSIEANLKQKILKDISSFTQITIAFDKDFEFLLKKNKMTTDDLYKASDEDVYKEFSGFDFIALFKKDEKNIKYKAFNLVTKVSEEFDMEDFLLYENQNWLFASQTGWLFIEKEITYKEIPLEVYIDYELKGYAPLLMSINHGEHNIKIVYAGRVLYTKDITIPFITNITPTIDKNLIENVERIKNDIELEKQDKAQAIFISIAVVLSMISGIIIPFIVF
jgi:hypothetical protein